MTGREPAREVLGGGFNVHWQRAMSRVHVHTRSIPERPRTSWLPGGCPLAFSRIPWRSGWGSRLVRDEVQQLRNYP